MLVLQFDPTRFREALDRPEVNRADVAEAICGGRRAIVNGTSQISRYARGLTRPTLPTIKKLANALGVKPEDLCVEVEL